MSITNRLVRSLKSVLSGFVVFLACFNVLAASYSSAVRDVIRALREKSIEDPITNDKLAKTLERINIRQLDFTNGEIKLEVLKRSLIPSDHSRHRTFCIFFLTGSLERQ